MKAYAAPLLLCLAAAIGAVLICLAACMASDHTSVDRVGPGGSATTSETKVEVAAEPDEDIYIPPPLVEDDATPPELRKRIYRWAKSMGLYIVGYSCTGTRLFERQECDIHFLYAAGKNGLTTLACPEQQKWCIRIDRKRSW